jgi:hypothetical protein
MAITSAEIKAPSLGPPRHRRTSWVDGLVGLIERVPGPPWVFYACITVFFVAGSTGLRWLDGHEPWDDVDPVRLTYATLTVYGLAVIHYLKRAASRSLTAFRPALGVLYSCFPSAACIADSY